MIKFKKGASVHYRSRARSGSGKIVEVRETERGLWYGVKTSEIGDVLFVRVSGLRALT